MNNNDQLSTLRPLSTMIHTLVVKVILEEHKRTIFGPEKKRTQLIHSSLYNVACQIVHLTPIESPYVGTTA